MGNVDTGSDVDLAIMNEGLDLKTISRIKSDFEESSLRHLMVIMLTGVHQQVIHLRIRFTDLCVVPLNGPDKGSDLHEIRAGAH